MDFVLNALLSAPFRNTLFILKKNNLFLGCPLDIRNIYANAVCSENKEMWDPLTEERKNRKFCKMFIQTTSTSAFKLRNPAVLYLAISLYLQKYVALRSPAVYTVW